MGGGRQVTWQQIGEGEGVDAGLVVGGLGEERPGKDLAVFDLTFETVFGDGPLVRDSCDENHVEVLELDLGLDDSEE